MPTRDEKAKQWKCDTCGTAFKYKRDATTCEKKHRLMKAWADDEISDQQLADGLGISIESVQEMKGESRTRSHQAGQGNFIAATQIYGNGRAQIPFKIRNELGLEDGSHIFWFKGPDGRFYVGASASMDYQRGRMSTRM